MARRITVALRVCVGKGVSFPPFRRIGWTTDGWTGILQRLDREPDGFRMYRNGKQIGIGMGRQKKK
jgi:hypothetical protein